MYRRDKGYRVGIAAHARSDGVSSEPQVGLKVRSNQENADRLWVLRVCETRDEARYWEAFYAIRYGVPTTVFHVRGRRMGLTQEMIDRLFRDIDTGANARQLLADLNMDWRFPHYLPQGIYRNVVNLRYFGDARRSVQSPWNAHRIDLWSNDPALRASLETQGYHARSANRNNWRIGFSRLQYDRAQATAQELSAYMGGAPIIVGAFLVDAPDKPLAPRFYLMPASHLHPSMLIAVEKDGSIVEAEVMDVTCEEYAGAVYDLEVDVVHNYLAGGVVVHNSVYRWRGADYRNVHRFQSDYPDALTILLEENYRSTQVILDGAMAVIDRHPGRTRKQLFTQRAGGVEIFAFEAYNEEEEAQFVVDTIAALTASNDYAPGDCAVMYRTNAQSRAVEEAFLRAGLPYHLVGAQRFYGRKEIRDLIAYLRLIHNPADSVSLLRVVNTPPRGVGAKTLEQLQSAASAAGLAPGDVLRNLGEHGNTSTFADLFAGRAGVSLANFGRALNRWHLARTELSVVQLMDLVLDGTGYKDYIDDGTEEGEERWANVMELRGVAAESDDLALAEFLEQVALVSDQDTLAEAGQAPTLLTLHAAKGLEFPVVFILGLDEGVLPHQRSFDDPEAMHEERRLMYVGMTRAKDRLYLLRAFRRSLYGDSSLSEPSRFLEDIPDDLLAGNVGRKKSSAERYYARATRWDRPSRVASVTAAKHKTGQRVRHGQFGEGIVVESKLSGGEEEVIVVFDEVGVKRLAADVANLEILKG
jgi:DNA helicase-2/ATP-dependent DNA helicase PcrA